MNMITSPKLLMFSPALHPPPEDDLTGLGFSPPLNDSLRITSSLPAALNAMNLTSASTASSP